MSMQNKVALALALLLSATLSASAATMAKASRAQSAVYDTIPGYDSNGQTVAIPNPDRR